MKLKRLNIENFHCFERTEFEFAEQATVFLGKNGTGKSSMIKAVCNALSFIFNKSNQESWGFSSLANEVSDLGVQNINVREIYHDDNIADYVSIKGCITMREGDGEHTLNWDYRKNSFEKSTLQSSLYKNAYIGFREILERTDRYPLMVYYSDRYPHINTNLGSNVKAMVNNVDNISRTWGYYHWNEFTSCTEIWQKRFIRISNQLTSIQRSLNDVKDDGAREALTRQETQIKNEIEYVTRYIYAFTDNEIEGLSDTSEDFKISSVSVDGVTDFYIKFLFADGVQRSWYELPAGMERLLSIVFDMAYRSYILNEGRCEPEGIVMIDELDLHLHPSLQQDVLIRLKHTFPMVQFIIATHSPLIATNLRQDEKNVVYKMEREGSNYHHYQTENLFVHDYTYTLHEVMGTEPRNKVLNDICERYIRLRHRNKIEKAEEVLDVLKSLVGEEDFPILQKRLEDEIAEG